MLPDSESLFEAIAPNPHHPVHLPHQSRTPDKSP
jgi:hypothetical protein